MTGDPLATVTVAARVARRQVDAAGQRRPRAVHRAPRPDRDWPAAPGSSTRRWSATVGAAPRPPGPPAIGRHPGAGARPGTGRWCTTSAPPADYDDWGLYAWGDIDPAYVTDVARRGSRSPGEDSYGRLRLGEAQAGREVRRLRRGRQGRQQGRRQRPHHRRHRRPARSGSSRATRRSTRPGRRPPANPTRRSTRAPRSSTTAGPTATTTAGACTCGTARPTRPTGPRPLQPERIDAFGAVFGCRWRPARPGSTTSSTRATPRTCPTTSGSTSPAPATRCGCWAARRAGCCRRPRPARADLDITQAAGALDRPVHRRLADRARPTAGRTPWSPPRRRDRASVDGELSGTYTTAAVAGAAQRAHRGPARGVPAPVVATRRFTLDRRDRARVPAALRGQLVVTERDAGGRPAAPRPACRSPACSTTSTRAATDADARADLRRPDADASRSGRPTARTVALQLFDRLGGSRARCRCAATTAPASGRSPAAATWTGKYYRYQVDGRGQPAAQKIVTNVGHRPVLGGADRRLHAQPDRRPGRPGAGPARAGRTLRKPAAVPRAEGADPGAARPRLLHRRHHRARPSTAAPTWPSPTRPPPA